MTTYKIVHKEHIVVGLPDIDETLSILEGMFSHFVIFSNAYLHRWFKMITARFSYGENGINSYLEAINRFYNEKFYEYDNKPLSYCKVILASNQKYNIAIDGKPEVS